MLRAPLPPSLQLLTHISHFPTACATVLYADKLNKRPTDQTDRQTPSRMRSQSVSSSSAVEALPALLCQAINYAHGGARRDDDDEEGRVEATPTWPYARGWRADWVTGLCNIKHTPCWLPFIDKLPERV